MGALQESGSPQGPEPGADPFPGTSVPPTVEIIPSGLPAPAPVGPVPPRAGPRTWGQSAPARTHRWGLGAYVLAEAVFLLSSVVISLGGDGKPDVPDILLALTVPTVLGATTAIVITQLRGNGPEIDLGLRWSWHDVGVGLVFGIAGLLLTIPASLIYVAIVGNDASSAVGDVFDGIRASVPLAVLVFLAVVFLAPICEEILYRGLLWGGLERLAGRWVAFGVSTLLFALAHLEFSRTPLLLVVAIPIALARLYTGRLLSSIVAHQVNNLLPGVVLMLGLLGAGPLP